MGDEIHQMLHNRNKESTCNQRKLRGLTTHDKSSYRRTGVNNYFLFFPVTQLNHHEWTITTKILITVLNFWSDVMKMVMKRMMIMMRRTVTLRCFDHIFYINEGLKLNPHTSKYNRSEMICCLTWRKKNENCCYNSLFEVIWEVSHAVLANQGGAAIVIRNPFSIFRWWRCSDCDSSCAYHRRASSLKYSTLISQVFWPCSGQLASPKTWDTMGEVECLKHESGGIWTTTSWGGNQVKPTTCGREPRIPAAMN